MMGEKRRLVDELICFEARIYIFTNPVTIRKDGTKSTFSMQKQTNLAIKVQPAEVPSDHHKILPDSTENKL